MKKLNRKGGSVVFAIIVAMISLMTVSALWFVFYPLVDTLATTVEIEAGTDAASFANLIMNVWIWLGAIMLFAIIVWVFAYTTKRDWESQFD